MAPEEEVIEPSTLTKFRKLRLKDVNLLDMLIGKTVEIALEHGLSKTVTRGNKRQTSTRFEFNKDAGMYVCQAGHMSFLKRSTRPKKTCNRWTRYCSKF